MININSQRREFNIVISDLSRCKRPIGELLDFINQSGYRYYAIKHDKDLNDNGELIRVHYHIVLSSLKRLRVKQILFYCCDSLQCPVENIQVQEVINLAGCIQYLIHKNDLSKYQYDMGDIITNDNDNLLSYLTETISFDKITTGKLIELIVKDKITRLELISAIGIGAYQHFRSTINDLYIISRGGSID